MKRTLLTVLCMTGLAMTLLPAFLVFAGRLSLTEHKNLMLLGSAIWFIAAPFRLKKEQT